MDYQKRKAEEALQLISSKSNMKIDIIRPALVYGPNMKGNLARMYKAIEKVGFLPFHLLKISAQWFILIIWLTLL